MKLSALLATLFLVLLTGCASTTQKNGSAPESTQNAVSSQPVPVPVTSTKKVVLNLTGPKTVTESSSWASFKEEWRATFEEHARDAGIQFSMLEGKPKPTGEAGTLLSTYVNDFRQVGIGARIFLGVMSGNAFIDAKVNFNDLKTGKSFGSQIYNTTSSAWHGVFGKMTPQQVDAIAAGVFDQLKQVHQTSTLTPNPVKN
tara:strand:+ start:143874 stop:144473 length:600 start_codon:yes stop_codon:yes gene_type:complete